MFRLTSCLAVLVLIGVSGVASGKIISWHASSGVLPNAPSIPADQRFVIAEEASFVSMQPDFMNVNDTSSSQQVRVMKNDIPPIGVPDSWAIEVELRMNSHARSSLDWGAELGVNDEGKGGLVIIAKDAIGFQGFNGDSYLNGLSHSIDTTDDFHTYRVVKDAGFVSLFVDSFDTSVVSVPYNDFFSNLGTELRPAASSGKGTANYDVRSFIANTNGTEIPEPSTLILLAMGALGLLTYGWRRRRRR